MSGEELEKLELENKTLEAQAEEQVFTKMHTTFCNFSHLTLISLCTKTTTQCDTIHHITAPPNATGAKASGSGRAQR